LDKSNTIKINLYRKYSTPIINMPHLNIVCILYIFFHGLLFCRQYTHCFYGYIYMFILTKWLVVLALYRSWVFLGLDIEYY